MRRRERLLAVVAGSAGVLAGSLLAAGAVPASAVAMSGYQVVFQANTGHLYTYDPATGASTNINLGVMAGTSPAIAVSASGDYEVAF
jgi:hypothetical protein